MAISIGNGSRKGSVRDRTQFERPDGNFQKRNTDDGKFMPMKNDGTPFKGVAKEVDKRRT